MSVDYSRVACEAFVQRALNLLEPPQLVAFWYYLAFGRLLCGDAIREAKMLANEWQKLSLWNQQGVLFQLVPHVEKAARDVAQARAKLARIKEPL